MTVIAALRTPRGIAVAWDSCVSWDALHMAASDPKVWPAWGGLVGVAGDCAPADVIRYAKVPKLRGDVRAWACTKLAPALRAAFAEQGLKAKHTASETLIAVRNEIVILDSHLGVTMPTLPYAAIGCGAQGTLCALAALLARRKPTRAVLREAVEATCLHVAGVGPPIHEGVVP